MTVTKQACETCGGVGGLHGDQPCAGGCVVNSHIAPCPDCTTVHEADITEEPDGFWTASCTCGWTELEAHPIRRIAVYHHDDHIDEEQGNER